MGCANIGGYRIRTESFMAPSDSNHDSKATPDVVKRYKQVWRFIRTHAGCTFGDIQQFLGTTEGNTMQIINGASLYPGSKIYEAQKKRYITYYWLEEV